MYYLTLLNSVREAKPKYNERLPIKEDIKKIEIKENIPIYDNNTPLTIRKKKGRGFMKTVQNKIINEFDDVEPKQLSEIDWEDIEKPNIQINVPKIPILPVPDIVVNNKKKNNKKNSDGVVSFLNDNEELDVLYNQYNVFNIYLV